MDFIDRIEEMQRLDRLAYSPEPGFAVIWGRRRMGKTRLLLEWVEKHRGIYYVADESTPVIQRDYFAKAIAQKLPGFADVEYPDWASLLSRLAREITTSKWRGPLVIDELPYLVSVSPELPSVLQKFIDHEAKAAKMVIALSGSSQRMMQGIVLDASAPLYGRADEIIKLGPIAPGYLQEALGLKSAREMIETYAVWGGVPRYWNLVNKSGGHFFQTIEQLVLDPMGSLHEEPQRLLIEEIPSAAHLRPLLDAIGLGVHRMSEIAGRIHEQATSLSRPMHRLIELDLVYREVPYGIDPENSKKALYKIKDPFVRFWFHVVASRRSFFSQVSPATRADWLHESLPHLYAITWEELCRQAVPRLSGSWKEVYGQTGRFWESNGGEWDVLSESIDSKHLLIGECKWTKKTPTSEWIHQTFDELKRKGIPPVKRPPEAKISYVLFVPEKPAGLRLHDDMRVVDAREVIEALR